MGKVGVILLAAGKGKRFGGYKQFENLFGVPMFEWTLEKYLFADQINLMLPQGVEYRSQHDKVTVLSGGKTRFDSIKNGFFYQTFKGWKVLIVDAARPFTKESMIHEIIEGLDDYEAVCPALPAFETVCRVRDGRIVKIYDREGQYFTQTPIGYRFEVLEQIFKYAEIYEEEKSFNLCYYIWKYGLGKTKYIEGDPENCKITYRKDLIRFAFREE